MRNRGLKIPNVPQFRIADAARLLGVSDDTVRRWIEAGTLSVQVDRSNRKVVDGAELAAFARRRGGAGGAGGPRPPAGRRASRPTRRGCTAPRATGWSGWSPPSSPTG